MREAWVPKPPVVQRLGLAHGREETFFTRGEGGERRVVDALPDEGEGGHEVLAGIRRRKETVGERDAEYICTSPGSDLMRKSVTGNSQES